MSENSNAERLVSDEDLPRLVSSEPMNDARLPKDMKDMIGAPLELEGYVERELNILEKATRYRFLFERLPVGFLYGKVVLDERGEPVDYIYLQVNATYERYTGLSRAAVLGKRATTVIPPVVHQTFDWIGTYGRVALSDAANEAIEFEQYSANLDRWFCFTVFSPTREYFVSISNDITDRKIAEQALRQSEEYHRSVLDNAKDMIITISTDCQVTSVNRAFEQLTGWQSDDLISTSFLSIVHPDECAGISIVWQHICDGESVPTYELRILTKPGEYLYGELSAAPLFDEIDVVGIVGILRDITHRKRAAEIRARYELLGQYARDIILFLDENGRILEANDAAIQAYGYERDELLSLKISDLWSVVVKDASPVPLKPTLAGHEGILFEATHRRKDGGLFDVEVSSRATAINGELVILSIIRDVSERKRTEENLRRTQSLLQHSEKMASIGQLAAGVAHEINNPLGFISSNLNTLGDYVEAIKTYFDQCHALHQSLKVGFDPQSATMLESLERSRGELDIDYLLADIGNLTRECQDGSQRMAKIVQALKTFARADDGEVKSANIEGILDSALNIVWNQLKYNCVVAKDYLATPDLKCNPNQLGQVFVNILVNAGQAIGTSKRGEIKIKSYADGDSVWIEISDNGMGIPQEHLDRIFDPFFTTKPAGQGTGLGLSISNNIVNKHGGKIFAESAVGRGTTFRIMLPAAP